jgi:hypothetical protein
VPGERSADADFRPGFFDRIVATGEGLFLRTQNSGPVQTNVRDGDLDVQVEPIRESADIGQILGRSVEQYRIHGVLTLFVSGTENFIWSHFAACLELKTLPSPR